MIILKCSECGHESMAKDECTAEIGLNMHKCSVDFSKLSDADLLDRIRKESGKIGSAVYSDWTRRQTYTKQPWWYLDNLEITKTKGTRRTLMLQAASFCWITTFHLYMTLE